MAKDTGLPISFKDANKLRDKAKTFHDNPTLKAAVGSLADPHAKMFYETLDVAFLFDKTALSALITKISTIPDGGLLVTLGASNAASREDRPTLSVFACKIDKTTDQFEMVFDDPRNPDTTMGLEHPGIVQLTALPSLPGKGSITFRLLESLEA